MITNTSDSNCIGNVIRILDTNTLLVNIGDSKLKKGDKVQVYEPVEMIKDLKGNDLEFYNYIKDTLEVIQVEKYFAICQKKEFIKRTSSFALSPLLEREVYETVPLNIDKNDIKPLTPHDSLIRIGDPIKLA